MAKIEKSNVNIAKNDILNYVKKVDDMVSLTDLWKQAGSPSTKRPIDWQEKESTLELIDTLSVMFKSGHIELLKTN